jgi:hypothetical protein
MRMILSEICEIETGFSSVDSMSTSGGRESRGMPEKEGDAR